MGGNLAPRPNGIDVGGIKIMMDGFLILFLCTIKTNHFFHKWLRNDIICDIKWLIYDMIATITSYLAQSDPSILAELSDNMASVHVHARTQAKTSTGP